VLAQMCAATSARATLLQSLHHVTCLVRKAALSVSKMAQPKWNATIDGMVFQRLATIDLDGGNLALLPS